MTRQLIHTASGEFIQEEGCENIAASLKDEGNTVWIAAEDPSPEDLETLRETLHLHPMSLDDVQSDGDRPKLRQFEDTVGITFFAARCTRESGSVIEFQPVYIVAGRRFLLTMTRGQMPERDEAVARWKDNAPRLTNDCGAPLYTLLDTLVDGYFPIIDEIADRVDDVEDQVVERQQASSLGEIFALKKTMLRFRRVAAASRDVVTVLLRHELFDERNDVYFQDVYDHVVRITDSVDTYRDLLSNAMDTYLTVTSNKLAESANRLNVTMQTLTSWSIIIGTGAVITGLYGMNVEGIPLAKSVHGFHSVLAVMFLAGVVLFAMFRRKRWV